MTERPNSTQHTEGKQVERWPGGQAVHIPPYYEAPRAVRIAAGSTTTIARDGMYEVIGESASATHIIIPTPSTGQRDIIIRNATDTECYIYPKDCTIELSTERIRLHKVGGWLRAEKATNWILILLTSWKGESVVSTIPPPEHPGDILFSLDGEVWVPAHPMTSTRGGWLVNDEAYTVVDSP